MIIETLAAALMAWLVANEKRMEQQTQITWKSTGNQPGEFYAIVGGNMVMRIYTPDGPLFYAACSPAIQYTNEADLLRFLAAKTRTA